MTLKTHVRSSGSVDEAEAPKLLVGVLISTVSGAGWRTEYTSVLQRASLQRSPASARARLSTFPALARTDRRPSPPSQDYSLDEDNFVCARECAGHHFSQPSRLARVAVLFHLPGTTVHEGRERCFMPSFITRCEPPARSARSALPCTRPISILLAHTLTSAFVGHATAGV